MPVLLLKRVDGFEVAKEAFVIPRVARVMNLFVSPFIGQEDFSGISPDICECIEDVSKGASQIFTLHWGRMETLR